MGSALICGAAGLIVPLLFDRDVGGAMASALLASAGLIIGLVAGIIIIRRRAE